MCHCAGCIQSGQFSQLHGRSGRHSLGKQIKISTPGIYFMFTEVSRLRPAHLWFLLQAASRPRWRQDIWDSGSPARTCGGSTVKKEGGTSFKMEIVAWMMTLRYFPHLAHQLCVDFGDAVDGARPLHAQLRGRVPGRGRAEGPDRAGDKHTQSMFGCYV